MSYPLTAGKKFTAAIILQYDYVYEALWAWRQFFQSLHSTQLNKTKASTQLGFIFSTDIHWDQAIAHNSLKSSVPKRALISKESILAYTRHHFKLKK